MKKIIALSFALCAAAAVHSQPRHVVRWEAAPRLHSVADSLLREPAVFILNAHDIQMQTEPGGFVQYYTTHRIVRLNNERGAEAFNTFTIPAPPGTRLYEIKARTILPGGRVVEVRRDKVKKMTSERGLLQYLIAMEGVTPGAEVEVLYTLLLPGTASGTEVYQFKVPVMAATFRMIVPDNMLYDAKGYNGFPTPRDSLMGDQRAYIAATRNIPSLPDEEDSRSQALQQRIDYKLSYVTRTERARERCMSWQDMASELHRKYGRFGDKSLDIADDVLRQAGVDRKDGEAEKIAAIEEYLKKTFTVSGSLSDEHAGELAQTVRTRLTTEKGLVRLFAACLTAADVRYETGMAGSRFRYAMDDSLEMWNHLGEYCFYFPALHTYLAPADVTCRYPYVPFELSGAGGIFTKTDSPAGEKPKVRADKRALPHTTMSQNSSSMNVSLRLDGSGLMPVVVTTASFRGHSAATLRVALLSASGDKERDVVQAVFGLAEKSSDIQSFKVENTGLLHYTTGKPLVLSATLHAPKLLEKAGPRYLLNAGALIGQQAQLYSADERKLPVEIEYPNEQLRTLRIAIPAGYRLVNPDVLRKRAACAVGGKEACGFISDYAIANGEVVVTIREWYERTDYPLAVYEAYRKVVNTAADFSKVVLVLQKG